MKLLLKENIDGLGDCGDEVEVKDGYGRNYLVPQGLAIQATPKNLKQFNHQKSIVQGRLRKAKVGAEERALEISKIVCIITKKIGDHGKLFGSVTAQDIADFLHGKGIAVDRKKIHLDEPIRTLGEFKAPYKLHPEVIAQISVTVVAENPPPAAKAPETTPENSENESTSETA
ncbi:MAG: 50S ribosomal protein L9 [Nitrospinae bacterium CG11_big_fil_rev_8_21_14_0_20_45_15]|nr:MAG: 50S ribosomal protein L9 [Nitrospinae bacterium CG11_big_fil_rev_8_21_14_0_20_45_15]